MKNRFGVIARPMQRAGNWLGDPDVGRLKKLVAVLAALAIPLAAWTAITTEKTRGDVANKFKGVAEFFLSDVPNCAQDMPKCAGDGWGGFLDWAAGREHPQD